MHDIKQENLRAIRKSYKLTQKKLADMLKISVRSIICYEANTQKCSQTALELLKYKLEELQENDKKVIIQ